MTEQIEITKAPGYVHLTYLGPFSIEGAKRSIDTMVATCMREKCARALYDIRQMTGAISTMERFNTATYGASKSRPAMRVAFVARSDQISPDNFFENVAHNRGVTLKVFQEFDQAVAWLESD